MGESAPTSHSSSRETEIVEHLHILLFLLTANYSIGRGPIMSLFRTEKSLEYHSRVTTPDATRYSDEDSTVVTCASLETTLRCPIPIIYFVYSQEAKEYYSQSREGIFVASNMYPRSGYWTLIVSLKKGSGTSSCVGNSRQQRRNKGNQPRMLLICSRWNLSQV